MASAIAIAPWRHPTLDDEASPFTVCFGDVRRSSDQRRRLSSALARSLFEPTDVRFNWLTGLELGEASAVARFEPGHGTLGQQAESGARGSRRLPLPFLWSLRTINAAAADMPDVLTEFSPDAVLTLGGGEARLNGALLTGTGEPPRFAFGSRCLLQTFGACIGARDSNRPLASQRSLLPSAVLATLTELSPRSRPRVSLARQREALRALELRLQGRFFVPSRATACPASDLVCRQLGLLGALATLEGESAVDAYFEAHRESWRAEPDFCTAFNAWNSERRLFSWHGKGRARQEAERERRAATAARVAQARLEFRRRDPTVALAFAVDAVCAAPESPEAWLALGEMRASTAPGSGALCFSEAICAARGDGETIAAVQRLLRLRSDAELSAYFRVQGDFALAEWLEPGTARSALSELSH